MKDTPDVLLAAAAAIFAKNGFQDANVVEICKLAGVNIAAISYHFGGKKKLYLKVLNYASSLADKEYSLYVDKKYVACPRERLAAFILAQFQRSSCDGVAGYFSRLLVHEMTNPTFAHEHIFHRTIAPMRDYLDNLLREILPKDIPEEYVWICHINIVSLFNFPMIMRTIHHFRMKKRGHVPPPPEAMAASATLFAFGGIDAIAKAAAKGHCPPALPLPPDYGNKTKRKKR